MKGCTPSKKSQMSFWRGMCVWGKGRGVGVRVRVDKTIIVLQCRKGSQEWWASRGLWEHHWRKCTHCLCSFFLHSASQVLLCKSRSYSFWPTPLPSLNSSSSYQHYSFSVTLWLMSFLILPWVKFVFMTFCIHWLFFSTGLHDQRMQTSL